MTYSQKVLLGNPDAWGIKPYGAKKPEWFDYPNGARIWLVGLDKPGKVLSSERDIIYVNQVEELKLDAWEIMTTRTTGRGSVIPFTQLIGDANPSGSKHWIRSRVGLTKIQSRHTDNPTLFDPETGELTEQGVKTMLRLDNLTGVRRKRLRDGIWATAEGAVYDMFDSDIHAIKRDPAEMKNWYLAIDEGYTNPAVILLIGVDNDGRWHQFREWYKRGKLQEAVVKQALEWVLEKRMRTVAVDAAAAGLIADMIDAGVPATPAKGRVLDGINRIQNKLKVQGDKRPRYTVDPDCVETINEFESYAWKPERDEPIKEYDHSMDALRYLDDIIGKNLPLQDNQPTDKSKWNEGDRTGWSKRY